MRNRTRAPGRPDGTMRSRAWSFSVSDASEVRRERGREGKLSGAVGDEFLGRSFRDDRTAEIGRDTEQCQRRYRHRLYTAGSTSPPVTFQTLTR